MCIERCRNSSLCYMRNICLRSHVARKWMHFGLSPTSALGLVYLQTFLDNTRSHRALVSAEAATALVSERNILVLLLDTEYGYLDEEPLLCKCREKVYGRSDNMLSTRGRMLRAEGTKMPASKEGKNISLRVLWQQGGVVLGLLFIGKHRNFDKILRFCRNVSEMIFRWVCGFRCA